MALPTNKYNKYAIPGIDQNLIKVQVSDLNSLDIYLLVENIIA